MRPVMMRPRNGLASSSVPIMRNGPGCTAGAGTCLTIEVEQRRQALVLRAFRLLGHPAVAARTVEDREIELLVGGVERGEQVEHLVDDLDMARVRPVDLVDDDDRLQADLERLADDELGLRHRAFGGVDQHDAPIDHGQDALDLAAEIGVAGRVDDVDAGVLPVDRGRLGEDGDAALLFEVVGIHRALGDALVLAERAGLLEKLVDQRGLAMVDVRDDRDVADVHDVVLGSDAAHGLPTRRVSFARAHTGFFADAKGADGYRKLAIGCDNDSLTKADRFAAGKVTRA